MLNELVDLFEYDRWANHRLLDACEVLPPEQLTRDMGSSFPSVLDTLAHLVGAEWIWLQRWRGASPIAAPAWDMATVGAIRARWAEVEEERTRYLSTLIEGSPAEVLTYRNLRGDTFAAPLWQLMRHVVNHSTHHRGQVVTMLRQLGASAPNTDLIAYFRDR